jgi:protein-disulfide isomerase
MSKLNPPVSKNDHIQGSPDALLELVEYGDFECPHCGAAHPIVKRIQKEFGKKLKFVFRHFPITNAHPHAFSAAVAAEAAGRQRKFWEMHDLIYEHQTQLSDSAFLAFANVLGLNMTLFEQDFQDQELSDKVEADFESGIRSGVNGTPSFYINGEKYQGTYDYESLSSAIESRILHVS